MSEPHEAGSDGPRPDGPDGRGRLVTALRRPGRGQSVVAVVLAVVGFAAVTQVRASSTDDAYSGLRQGELVQALNGLTATARRAESDITTLEATRDSLRSSTEQRATALAQAGKQLADLGILAGTVPAQGPGVRITIEDPAGRLTLNNLLDGIEELRDAGAEVMEINDRVRVVAQTSFEVGADGGIVVDGQALKAPYTIDAIGGEGALSKALVFPGGFRDTLALNDVDLAIKKLDPVEVTSVRTVERAQYAVPVPDS